MVFPCCPYLIDDLHLSPHAESGKPIGVCRCSERVPTATLGMAPFMVSPDLGNLSIVLEMLLGIWRRLFLQQR